MIALWQEPTILFYFFASTVIHGFFLWWSGFTLLKPAFFSADSICSVVYIFIPSTIFTSFWLVASRPSDSFTIKKYPPGFRTLATSAKHFYSFILLRGRIFWLFRTAKSLYILPVLFHRKKHSLAKQSGKDCRQRWVSTSGLPKDLFQVLIITSASRKPFPPCQIPISHQRLVSTNSRLL